ncbi:MAG: DUF1146 family protein [bacterium]
MDSNYIYFIGIIVSFPIVFRILFKLKFQELFKTNNVWEIKVAYILFSIAICHLLASFLEKFYLISN